MATFVSTVRLDGAWEACSKSPLRVLECESLEIKSTSPSDVCHLLSECYNSVVNTGVPHKYTTFVDTFVLLVMIQFVYNALCRGQSYPFVGPSHHTS